MRNRHTQIDIDLVNEIVDVGELAKAGVKLGFDVRIEPGDQYEQEDEDRKVVRLIRNMRVWGEDELLALAVIYGMAYGKSGEEVLALLRRKLEGLEFPLDKPISDVMGIGQGPAHEGHQE